MKKLSLMVMALPCLFLIACETQEFQTDDFKEYKVGKRSANTISINYQDANGTISLSCTSAEVFYLNTSQIDLYVEYANSTIDTILCQNVQLDSSNGFVLNIVKDDNTAFESDDLSVEICDTTLCYSASNPSITGSSVRFIIGDEPEGF